MSFETPKNIMSFETPSDSIFGRHFMLLVSAVLTLCTRRIYWGKTLHFIGFTLSVGGDFRNVFFHILKQITD